MLDLFFPIGPVGTRKDSGSATPSSQGGGEASRSGSVQSDESGRGSDDGVVLQMQQSVDDSNAKDNELTLVLSKLKDVDGILEQLAVFWAHTEVILEVLLQKSEHVERFVEFAHKPRLLSRFKQRMDEYKKFWESVQVRRAALFLIPLLRPTRSLTLNFGDLSLCTSNYCRACAGIILMLWLIHLHLTACLATRGLPDSMGS